MKKYQSLKKVYYRSFAVLIVIPILIVFVSALYIVNIMMRSSAISNIKSAQSTVIASLREDIRGASLQLSHFVYVNNSELMELAAKTDTNDSADRYTYTSRLNESFQVAMTPRQDIISCMVYMKSGYDTYLKDKIVIPDEIIKAEEWYLNAIENKNIVKVGSYDTSDESITYARLKGREFIIVVALSPGIAVDKAEKIEMISMFVQTRIGNSIKEFNRKSHLGTMVILDEKDRIIYGGFMDENAEYLISQMELNEDGVFGNRFRTQEGKLQRYTSVISSIEDTGWKVVTYVRPGKLTAAFNRTAIIMIAVIICLFIMFFMFSRYFLKNIITPVHSMVGGFKSVETGNLNTSIETAGQSEIRDMIQSFNHMVKRLKVSIRDKEEAQEKRHEAEMKALQSQINPHFLVNTLNSIRFMAQVSHYDGIRKMAESLISILACSFRQNTSLYSVKEELEVLESYIYLMKIRYSDGFDVDFDIDETCKELKIPRLILQPIVENSIVHGFSEMEDRGHIKISAYRKNNSLFLEIYDNGKGISEAKINTIFERVNENREDSYNIGIENVYNRLKLRFGEACDMTIDSKEKECTTTLIMLPAMEETESEESSDC